MAQVAQNSPERGGEAAAFRPSELSRLFGFSH